MTMNLGALGQTCSLCGRPVGAPSTIVIPGQPQGASVTCGGHQPEEAMHIMLQRIMQLEHYVGQLLQAPEPAPVENQISVSVPEGMTDEAAIAMIADQVADAIERDDS